MELKAYLHRLENIKAIHDLDAAGLDHHVIAVFLSAEGISMTAQEVTTIVNTYDAEPYRVCRRVNILRDYPDDKTKLYPRN